MFMLEHRLSHYWTSPLSLCLIESLYIVTDDKVKFIKKKLIS